MPRSLQLAGLLVLFFLLTSSSGVARADQLDDEVRRIAKQLQCPICESVSVADSPAELAQQMRALIRRKLEAGEGERQVIDYFVAAYGDMVLTEPPRRGLALLVWLGPLAALVSGGVLLLRVLKSWRVRGSESSIRSRRQNLGASDDYDERAAGELDRVRRIIGG